MPPSSVGVVIPAYNPGPRLRIALDSVVAQTYPDWECVVIDDGGEESLEWVDGYHPNVTRHSQPNAGVSAARNNALLHTDAELIAYLDQDDEWHPEKLKMQVAAMAQGADFSWTGFAWKWPDRMLEHSPRAYDYSLFLDDGHVCLSSLVVRRVRLMGLGGFNPLFRVQQDYELVLRFFAAAAVSAFVNESLVTYHLHEANVSGDYLTAYRERILILQMHANAAALRGERRLAAAAQRGRRRAARTYGGQAYDAFRETRRPGHLARALWWNPRYTVPALGRAVIRPR